MVQDGVTADTAVEVVGDLTSTVGEGSDEDQNTENLEVINEVLNSVTDLISTGNFTANEHVCMRCIVLYFLSQIRRIQCMHLYSMYMYVYVCIHVVRCRCVYDYFCYSLWRILLVSSTPSVTGHQKYWKKHPLSMCISILHVLQTS